MRATKPARRYAGVCGTGIVVRLACKGLTFANFALVFSEIGKSVRVFAAAVVADPDGVRGFRKGWCVVMLSYYRTLFDINSNDESLVGLPLLGDVERALRIWVADYFPGQPDILRDPEPEEKSGRRWETDDALLRFSGGEVGEQGYFWLRWHAGGYAGSDGAGNGSDGGYRRYLGFRLATEGDAVQADVEIRVEDRDDGHFDDAFSVVMDNLTDAYRCASMGAGLSQRAALIPLDDVEAFFNRLVSPNRCLPIVVVSEKRGGGMPVDGNFLQRGLLGLADVAVCKDAVAWQLGYNLWELLCYDGQVRIYAPHWISDDDPLRHRVWSAEDVASLGPDAFVQLLRDECSQRIYYPEGRDALRVFSRVRGRVRARIRELLSVENQRLWDEWVEDEQFLRDEIQRLESEKADYIDRNNDLNGKLLWYEQENQRLNDRISGAGKERDKGYGVSELERDGDRNVSFRTVEEVVAFVEDWQYIRVFRKVAGDCRGMPATDARRFFDVLRSLNECGRERASLGNQLGVSEEKWMEGRTGHQFAGGEGRRTMQQYGDSRRFGDDNGRLVEMSAHLKIGRELRLHLVWSPEETRWLVGYFGRHLPIVSG